MGRNQAARNPHRHRHARCGICAGRNPTKVRANNRDLYSVRARVRF